MFERQGKEIDEAFQEKKTNAGAGYVNMLQSMIKYMEKTGDEFGVRPAAAEIKRFQEEQSVPAEPEVGTPKLIQEGRTKYLEALARAQAEKDQRMQLLTKKYLEYLTKLEGQLKRASKNQDVELVAKEIKRVSSTIKDDRAIGATIRLPRKFVLNLALAYTFADMEDRRVWDLSGRRRHGDLLGAKRIEDKKEGVAFTFLSDNDMLELEEVDIDGYWTVSARVRFPLEKRRDPRVLVSHGYRQDHIVVDPKGILGIGSGNFVGSGYNVNSLRGWHELTVVSGGHATAFYVDGKRVGVSRTACKDSIKAIGNSAAGGRPWSGSLASIMLWTVAFSANDVAELYEVLHGKAGNRKK